MPVLISLLGLCYIDGTVIDHSRLPTGRDGTHQRGGTCRNDVANVLFQQLRQIEHLGLTWSQGGRPDIELATLYGTHAVLVFDGPLGEFVGRIWYDGVRTAYFYNYLRDIRRCFLRV